jgi:hypothetical protein
VSDSQGKSRFAATPKGRWISYALVALLLEKVVQHAVVSLAFAFNWGDIGSTVAVDSTTLAVLGSIVAVLFGISVWAVIVGRRWATVLIMGLALFDIVGEFVVQGRLAIAVTVSFVMATIILILAVLYRRGNGNAATTSPPNAS